MNKKCAEERREMGGENGSSYKAENAGFLFEPEREVAFVATPLLKVAASEVRQKRRRLLISQKLAFSFMNGRINSQTAPSSIYRAVK